MGFLVVRGVERWVQPERLGVGNCAQITRLVVDHFGGLAFDGADEEVLVVLEDFVAMEVVEGFGGILACDLTENDFASWVGVDEIGYIVDFVVDDDPEVILGSVL